MAAHPGAYVLSRAMRRRPIVRLPRLGVLVNDASLVREVLLDHDTYVKNGTRGAAVPVTQIFGPYALLNQDGDEHKQLRLALRTLFTPAAVRELAATVARPLLADLRTTLEQGGRFDMVRFSQLVSGSLMSHLAGLSLEPEELHRRAMEIHARSRTLTTKLSIGSLELGEGELAEAHAAFAEMVAGVDAAWDRGHEDTVPGRLRAHGVDKAGTRGVLGTLMIAGTDTTSSAIARMVALLCDTGQLTRVRAHPELLGPMVDETFRYAAPVPVMTRTIARDTRLGGRALSTDTQMLVFVVNALRDRRVIADGDVYDVAREMPRELRQLWFGAGQHFCIGYAIGRRLLEETAQVLLDLPNEVRIVHRRPAAHVLLPAYAELVVESADH